MATRKRQVSADGGIFRVYMVSFNNSLIEITAAAAYIRDGFLWLVDDQSRDLAAFAISGVDSFNTRAVTAQDRQEAGR